jgi:pimeloyl-ACP methyl ester carboxylesterase
MQTAQMREGIVHTSDGRELRVLEVGDPDGYPVLHHHGTPSCRLEVAHHDEDFGEKGLRIIAVDRPGYGQSSPHRGATVGEWAADATCVADHLDLDSFGVSGYSAGGPFATSVAAALATRVDQLALFAAEHPSVLGPFPADAIYIEAAVRLGPDEFEEFFGQVPADEIPEVEVADVTDPADAELLMAVVMEALLQGNIGPASYYWSVVHPWGFELTDIATNTMLWHGERDAIVPPVSSTRYAEEMQNAAVTMLPDEGHLTIWRRAPELFAQVFRPA